MAQPIKMSKFLFRISGPFQFKKAILNHMITSMDQFLLLLPCSPSASNSPSIHFYEDPAIHTQGSKLFLRDVFSIFNGSAVTEILPGWLNGLVSINHTG